MLKFIRLKLSWRSFLFLLFALVILSGLVYYLYYGKGRGAQDGALGASLWGKRNLASSWTAEFEGEVKSLSSTEITLKINGEEITIPLDPQTTFVERKPVKVEGVPGAYNFESQPLVPDDFAAQIGKQAKVLLMLVENDLKGIQVQVLSLQYED